MSAAVVVPDFFKLNKPNAVFLPPPGEDIESLSAGIGSSYPVIGYKGKNWSLRYKGENHLFLRPDDGTPISYIDVVILRQAKVKSKSFYSDGYDENASAGKRPTCASLDGERPDTDVHIKQAEACAICPRNDWRTDAKTGRKSRECQDYKRLAVLVLPSQTQRMLGEPLIEAAFLRVPPASLNDLAVFGDTMARQGWPYHSFVVRISFDVQAPHPKFEFKAISALGPEEAKIVVDIREETQAKRVTGEDSMTGPKVMPTALPVQTIGLAGAPAATGAVTQPVTQQTSQPAHIQQPAQQQTLDLQPQSNGAFGVGTGFNTPPGPAPTNTVPNTGAVGQTAADVGEVSEDSEMDKRIAALLNV